MSDINIIWAMLSLLFSCNTKPAEIDPEKKKANDNRITVWELSLPSGDTINAADAIGRKQRHWIVRQTGTNLPIEKGDYKDNRKNGWWMYYDSSGKLMRKVFFTNDRAH